MKNTKAKKEFCKMGACIFDSDKPIEYTPEELNLLYDALNYYKKQLKVELDSPYVHTEIAKKEIKDLIKQCTKLQLKSAGLEVYGSPKTLYVLGLQDEE